MSRYTVHPKPEECDSCGWETDQLTEVDAYARTRGRGPCWGWLCDVCRRTPAGNAYRYPDQHRGQEAILRTIAWGINRVLHEQRITTAAPERTDEH